MRVLMSRRPNIEISNITITAWRSVHKIQECQNIWRHTVPKVRLYAAQTMKFQMFDLQFYYIHLFLNVQMYAEIYDYRSNGFLVTAK